MAKPRKVSARRRRSVGSVASVAGGAGGGASTTSGLSQAIELRSVEPGLAVQLLGSLHWLLITGRIQDARICRVLDRSPIVVGWQTGHEIVLDGATLIGAVEKPARADDVDDAIVVDPVSNEGRDDGDLFVRYAWDR